MEPLHSDWRTIDEPARPVTAPGAAAPTADRLPLVLAALGVCALLAGAAVFLWSTTPAPALVVSAAESSFAAGPNDLTGIALTDASSAPIAWPPDIASPSVVVVDVEGAVMRPGLQRLPAGSRVGDAIAAAGGFSARVDAARVASALNLAEHIHDGGKVDVPVLGEATPVTVAAPDATHDPAPGAPVPGGLIDLNSATAMELETLPGIGPVTAGEIIAARAAAPFATVDELLARGVVGPSTMDKIRALVTVGG